MGKFGTSFNTGIGHFGLFDTTVIPVPLIPIWLSLPEPVPV